MGGISGKGHARGAVITHVSEHHGLDVDRRAPIAGDVMDTPVFHGPGDHPTSKNGADGAPELVIYILGKRLS